MKPSTGRTLLLVGLGTVAVLGALAGIGFLADKSPAAAGKLLLLFVVVLARAAWNTSAKPGLEKHEGKSKQGTASAAAESAITTVQTASDRPPSSAETSRSPYEVLQLTPAATSSEIKRAYHRLAVEYLDGANSADSMARNRADEMTQELNAAYAILSDTNRRSEYDSTHQLRPITIKTSKPAQLAPGVMMASNTPIVTLRSSLLIRILLGTLTTIFSLAGFLMILEDAEGGWGAMILGVGSAAGLIALQAQRLTITPTHFSIGKRAIPWDEIDGFYTEVGIGRRTAVFFRWHAEPPTGTARLEQLPASYGMGLVELCQKMNGWHQQFTSVQSSSRN